MYLALYSSFSLPAVFTERLCTGLGLFGWFVGYCFKVVLIIMLLAMIVSIVDKDGRYESNGVTYELDKTALIIIGVICK